MKLPLLFCFSKTDESTSNDNDLGMKAILCHNDTNQGNTGLGEGDLGMKLIMICGQAEVPLDFA